MSYSVSRRLFAIFVTGVLASFAIASERAFDRSSRTAIISAFQRELTTLLANVKGPSKHVANGVEFTTGTLGGKRVVLYLSGKGENEIEMFFKLGEDNSKKVLMAFLAAWK